MALARFGGATGTLALLGDQGIGITQALTTELGIAAAAAPCHVNREGLGETVAFLGLVLPQPGQIP